MTLRVAVTRAPPQAEATAMRLRMLGYDPVLAPLLTIETRTFDTNVEGVQALLFTSANGVWAFAAASDVRDVLALCVGDATAAAAREAGFRAALSADGDAAALTALAQDKLDPHGGRLVHVAGAHVAGDLVGSLAAVGFTVERRIAYEARAAAKLPQAFDERLDVVLFHSARAAETFLRLGAPNANRLTAACLSPAVAAAAAGPPWKAVVVAPAPRDDALLQALPK
jgi:uroporphyrinogen-III synthase